MIYFLSIILNIHLSLLNLLDSYLSVFVSLFSLATVGCEVYNLGTGKGTSVLEMVAAFEKASGMVLSFKIVCSLLCHKRVYCIILVNGF